MEVIWLNAIAAKRDEVHRVQPWPLATLREQPSNLGLWPRYGNNPLTFNL
ncbi:hypothetical protein [Moorena producens]|nr:hypothetical protein [Moorena producens]